ncbi:sulfite exporter TauE/SafE family protein [bacterium]|nr:sulfite exporter TauE/SafE family protein [bacterium]
MDMTLSAPLIISGIAFVFSMLGMGGSQLYIPVLFWMGMDFKTEAIPLGLLLNILNSSSAAFTYGRKKLIDWRTGVPFAIASVGLAPVGAWLNVKLPTRFLIGVFAAFSATAAILMLSGWKAKHGELTSRGRLILGICGGGTLGFVAGLIGRGGGSFIVPMLVIAGLAPKMAAATSAFIITWSAGSSFLSHVALAASPNWAIWAPCILGVLIASQLGSRLMAAKLKSGVVRFIFGIVLLAVAAALTIQDVILH